jgi:hypothetical protein
MLQASENTSRVGFYIKRSFGFLLILLLSATFFYSAYTKVYSENAFDNFQWTFLDFGINNIIVAGIIARTLIGFELLLGLLLLGHLFLKEFTYKAVILLLLLFVGYLVMLILKQGNTGNCGCFGDKLAMTPMQAIWKNLIMISITLVLMRIHQFKNYSFAQYAVMIASLIAFSTPYLSHAIVVSTAPVSMNQPIDLGALYKFEEQPNVDLRKGKHIVAFMSLTCPHCKKAAFLLQIIHRKHPEIPIYMVIAGHPDNEKDFWEETQAKEVPHILYSNASEFEKMAGPAVPSIYWVNNSIIEYKSKLAYYQLDPSYMMKWLSK